MKRECGYPITKPPKTLFSQRHWRTTGMVTLGVACLMAWYGSRRGFLENEPTYLMAYWGIFALFIVIAVYMALIDIRYIRMEYKMGERALFEDTLGEESFREELRKARGHSGDTDDKNGS
jgi:hypothetical protein